ncbi:MAG: phage protein Gp27 family protein, partial [Candidatus Latescibacterota bacterium]
MAERRTHFKLQELPEDIQRTADRMISEGKTYRDIAAWLDEQGYEVSKSSVARYGATFLASLERLKVVGEQVKAILADTD